MNIMMNLLNQMKMISMNFLKEIEGNEEKLNMLSIDRLKKLEKYYDNIIAENDKKIKKLKASA